MKRDENHVSHKHVNGNIILAQTADLATTGYGFHIQHQKSDRLFSSKISRAVKWFWRSMRDSWTGHTGNSIRSSNRKVVSNYLCVRFGKIREVGCELFVQFSEMALNKEFQELWCHQRTWRWWRIASQNFKHFQIRTFNLRVREEWLRRPHRARKSISR